MAAMRYKSYVFPHNPARLEVEGKALVAGAHCPGYGPVYQHLGTAQRVITGEGSFFGPGAQGDYAALGQVFFQAGPGMLFLPAMTPVRAFFTRLAYLGQGDGEIIRYAFQFVEDLAPAGQTGGGAYADLMG